MKFWAFQYKKIMATHSKKEISVDLFNLPPLPDERNAMDSYLDISNNYYIPNGRNSRLMNITTRNVFDRKMVNGNEGFVLEIPFLEGEFGTKHFIVDKVNGEMAGIYDDMVEVIKCQTQMEPFNLKQLNTMVAMLEQKRQGFDVSLIADPHEAAQQTDQQDIVNRLEYPSTPKDLQSFNRLRDMKYDGKVLTSKRRSKLYWDRAKVIIEMVDSLHVFGRYMYFNPGMTNTYHNNINKYTGYFTSVIRNINVYLQEDQLMRTKSSFPLVPVPTYLPTSKELTQSSVHHIEDAVN